MSEAQLDTIRVIYKFRFVNAHLMSQLQSKTEQAVNARMRILVNQGLVAKRYNGHYRIAGRAAEYYLTHAGIKILKQKADYSTKMLHNIYNDKRVKDEFINRCLAVLKINNKLKNLYGPDFKFFTKINIAKYNYFPKPLPDGYVSFQNKTEHLMLQYLDQNTTNFAIKRIIYNFNKHKASGTWDSTNSPYPIVLMICETSKITKLAKQCLFRLGVKYWSEITFVVISTDALYYKSILEDQIKSLILGNPESESVQM